MPSQRLRTKKKHRSSAPLPPTTTQPDTHRHTTTNPPTYVHIYLSTQTHTTHLTTHHINTQPQSITTHKHAIPNSNNHITLSHNSAYHATHTHATTKPAATTHNHATLLPPRQTNALTSLPQATGLHQRTIKDSHTQKHLPYCRRQLWHHQEEEEEYEEEREEKEPQMTVSRRVMWPCRLWLYF